MNGTMDIANHSPQAKQRVAPAAFSAPQTAQNNEEDTISYNFFRINIDLLIAEIRPSIIRTKDWA
jgi:hypothetical protein